MPCLSPQFLSRRIDGLCESGRGFRRAIGEIVLRCGAQGRFVGLKIRCEIALEAVPIVSVERAQYLMQLARYQCAGRFAALRQQCRGKLLRAAEQCRAEVG